MQSLHFEGSSCDIECFLKQKEKINIHLCLKVDVIYNNLFSFTFNLLPQQDTNRGVTLFQAVGHAVNTVGCAHPWPSAMSKYHFWLKKEMGTTNLFVVFKIVETQWHEGPVIYKIKGKHWEVLSMLF